MHGTKNKDKDGAYYVSRSLVFCEKVQFS